MCVQLISGCSCLELSEIFPIEHTPWSLSFLINFPTGIRFLKENSWIFTENFASSANLWQCCYLFLLKLMTVSPNQPTETEVQKTEYSDKVVKIWRRYTRSFRATLHLLRFSLVKFRNAQIISEMTVQTVFDQVTTGSVLEYPSCPCHLHLSLQVTFVTIWPKKHGLVLKS